MKYRDFGKTGLKISQIGFGCMRLPEIERHGQRVVDEEKAIPMLRRGYELGINYFDTAVGFITAKASMWSDARSSLSVTRS